MNGEYKVTICIPTYNRVDSLRECVESIAKQHCAGVQVCICNNASIDETQAYLDELSYPWVKTFTNAANLGMARNLNRVLFEADGEYCFILTDDDRFAAGKLSSLLDYLNTYSPGLLLSHLYSFREHEKDPTHKRHWFSSTTVFDGSVQNAELLGGQTWAWSRLCFRKSYIDFELLRDRIGNGYHLTFALIDILIARGAVYVDCCFVEHVIENKVYWEMFGENKAEIALKLDFDLAEALSYKCSEEYRRRCTRTALYSFAKRPDGLRLASKFKGAGRAIAEVRAKLKNLDSSISPSLFTLYTLMSYGWLRSLPGRLFLVGKRAQR